MGPKKRSRPRTPALIDVADDRQDRVVRRVPGPEERDHVLDARSVEILHRADGRVVVRVAVREDRRHELLVEGAVGPVVVALALLVLDHLALVVEVLLAQRVEQRRHPVGLQPQPELELVRRQRLEVVGAVEVGGGVVDAAGTLDDGHVLGLGDVARALEHEVLEQVREAGLARRFVARADGVPEVDGHHRREGMGGTAMMTRQARLLEPALASRRVVVRGGKSRTTAGRSVLARPSPCGRRRAVRSDAPLWHSLLPVPGTLTATAAAP